MDLSDPNEVVEGLTRRPCNNDGLMYSPDTLQGRQYIDHINDIY